MVVIRQVIIKIRQKFLTESSKDILTTNLNAGTETQHPNSEFMTVSRHEKKADADTVCSAINSSQFHPENQYWTAKPLADSDEWWQNLYFCQNFRVYEFYQL